MPPQRILQGRRHYILGLLGDGSHLSILYNKNVSKVKAKLGIKGGLEDEKGGQRPPYPRILYNLM